MDTNRYKEYVNISSIPKTGEYVDINSLAEIRKAWEKIGMKIARSEWPWDGEPTIYLEWINASSERKLDDRF